MENWITILRLIDGVLSAAAATMALINNLVYLRRNAGASSRATGDRS